MTSREQNLFKKQNKKTMIWRPMFECEKGGKKLQLQAVTMKM